MKWHRKAKKILKFGGLSFSETERSTLIWLDSIITDAVGSFRVIEDVCKAPDGTLASLGNENGNDADSSIVKSHWRDRSTQTVFLEWGDYQCSFQSIHIKFYMDF